jgi:hypothetical protein
MFVSAISKATLPTAGFGSVAMHLGCGPKYLPGFVNIDANPLQKIDMGLDLRCALPFAHPSVDSIDSTRRLERPYPEYWKIVFVSAGGCSKSGPE